MKVPAYIKRKMRIAAGHFAFGAALMREVDDWFSVRGFPPEVLRLGDGTSLEELECGNDVTDEFCARFDSSGFGPV